MHTLIAVTKKVMLWCAYSFFNIHILFDTIEHMKKNILVHCGNAPKMERVIDLAVALAERKFTAVTPLVREDFTWRIVGEKDVTTYDQLAEMLNSLESKVAEIHVENALSHGNGAMCEGTLYFNDGKIYYFCHVAKFTSTTKDALIKSLHTYMVAR